MHSCGHTASTMVYVFLVSFPRHQKLSRFPILRTNFDGTAISQGDEVARCPEPTAMMAWAPGIIGIIGVICGGLVIDQTLGFKGQVFINIAVWLLYLHQLSRASPTTQTGLVACVAYATLGEIFLSLIWGLYDYRLTNIPLFVPPGHALLFILGGLLARRAATWIVWLVPLAAAPFVLLLALTGTDTLGLALFTIFLACVVFGRAKKFYAVMFVLALAMEIFGTWLGNWSWKTTVPWLGLTTLNPPLAAGAFYCVLDMLVVATVAAVHAPRRKPGTAGATANTLPDIT